MPGKYLHRELLRALAKTNSVSRVSPWCCHGQKCWLRPSSVCVRVGTAGGTGASGLSCSKTRRRPWRAVQSKSVDFSLSLPKPKEREVLADDLAPTWCLVIIVVLLSKGRDFLQLMPGARLSVYWGMEKGIKMIERRGMPQWRTPEMSTTWAPKRALTTQSTRDFSATYERVDLDLCSTRIACRCNDGSNLSLEELGFTAFSHVNCFW